MSEFTLAGIVDRGKYHHRFLGKVQVKGKKEAVAVFEIYDGDTDAVKALKISTQTNFEEGLRCYFAKEFVAAAGCFKKVLAVSPDDKTAQLYLERSAQFMVQGVPEDWQGIEIMESK